MPLAAVATPPGTPPAPLQSAPLPPIASRNELSFDVGYYVGVISYARRLGESSLSLGAGLWGAWQPPGSFDKNVWEPAGVALSRATGRRYGSSGTWA